MKYSKKPKLPIVMIISGIVLLAITTIYFIFQSNQWVQDNTRWFVFAGGIVLITLGIIILLSTKQNNSTDNGNNTKNSDNPKGG